MKKIVLMALLGIATLYASPLTQALLNGNPRGLVGMYGQGMSGGGPSFVDAHINLGYDSKNLRGYSVGGAFWVAPKVFQSKGGDYAKVKRTFAFTEAFLKFQNPNRLTFEAGRFYTDEEWIKHYTQGARVLYQDIQNVDLGAVWAMSNAYVTHYRMNDFANPFGNMGAFYGYGDISLANAPLKLKPYIYLAHNAFNVFGVRVDLMLPLTSSDKESVFFAKMHLVSYIENGRKDPIATQNGDGGFVWLEGGIIYVGVKIGGGVISVSQKGASGIDAFGQSTHFERREGIFYSNATTLYGFLDYELKKLVTLQGAIRNTSLGGGKNIFNWEVGIKSTPQPNMILGAGMIGMVNNAPYTLDNAVFAADGKNYILFRGYAQLRF